MSKKECRSLKKRFLLIDSENVQNRLFEIIEGSRKRDRIIIFYTVYHSGKLEEYLKEHKEKKNIEFVQCIAGNNALDLQLMGVLSYLIQKHPKKEFVVYSNDKGYKTLVKHWQSKNVDIELVNFLTPAVGEEAIEFRSPITVETMQKKSRGRKSRVSLSSARSLSAPKTSEKPEKSVPAAPEKPSTAVVESSALRRGSSSNKKNEAASAETLPQKPAAEEKKQPVPTENTAVNDKPAAPEEKPQPRAVVDALLIGSHNDNKPGSKPRFNNVVAPRSEEKEPAKPESPTSPVIAEAAPEAPAEKKPDRRRKQQTGSVSAPAEKPAPKKRGRKSKAEKEAEAAAALKPEEAPAGKTVSKPSPKKKNAEEKSEPSERQEAEKAAEQPKKTENERPAEDAFVKGICRSVRSTDLALINRVLTIGFGSESAKSFYVRFKSDPEYREEMGRLYNYSKPERVRLLLETALEYNRLDAAAAEIICRIIGNKGTENMQALYHSFIKEMPGNVAERQLIYKTVKPYLALLENL